jgi:acyl-homoserine lactone synthase
VVESGWTRQQRPVDLEIDQYDTMEAIYLLLCDGEQVIGGQRLAPTTRPHMLEDFYAHMAPRGVPTGEDIFEWTRVHVSKGHREGSGVLGRTTGELLIGLFEFCLEEGISTLTSVGGTWWLPQLLDLDWDIAPLGLPTDVDGKPTLAYRTHVTQDALERMRDVFSVRASVLVRRGLQQPVIDRVRA